MQSVPDPSNSLSAFTESGRQTPGWAITSGLGQLSPTAHRRAFVPSRG
jgi:hypothetical protein